MRIATKRSKPIAVEAFLLRKGHTGVERYILNLIRTLVETSTVPVTVFISSSCRLTIGSNPNLTVKALPVRSLWVRVMFQHLLFPFWLRGHGRVFFTGYLGSLLFPLARTAVAVFDLIALDHPHLVRSRTRWYYRFLLPWFLRGARLLVVPSEKVRRGVLAFGPRGRVLKLPIPVEDRFYLDRTSRNAVIEPSKAYILLVGFGEKKKNHHLLHEIAPRFPEWTFQLVGKRPVSEIFPPNVLLPGFVPQDVLVELYRRCRLLLFLSREEGYGLPVFEALVTGTPVLCWRVAPFVEIESPLLHFPERDDLESLVEKLRHVVARPKEALNGPLVIPRWHEYWATLEHELLAC